MSDVLQLLLWLVFNQALCVIVFTCGEWLTLKNKTVAKKIFERLGLVFLGMLEALFVVFIFWIGN